MILNRYYVEVYEQRGGCLPRLVTLEELNTLISAEEQSELTDLQTAVGTYTPHSAGNTISTELAEVYAAIKTQGFVQKLEAMATREDDIYEELNNKILNDPIINPVGVGYATYSIMADIDETPTEVIKLTSIQPGAAGNALTVTVIGDTPGGSYTAPNIEITCDATSTVAELTKALQAIQEITDIVIIEVSDGMDDVTGISPVAVAENFSGGTDGTAALSSTSEEIDAAVDKSPTSGTPITEQTYATGRLTFAGATNPTDGDTITVGSKTYTFRDALTEGGLKNEILICLTNVPDDTCLAIQYAINATAGQTAFYGTDTTANADVVATAGDNLVDLTCEGSTNAATLLGTAGNAVVTTVSAGLTEASFGSAHLTGGLDITAADAGKIIVGSGGIYVAKAQCTATSSNWETISYDV